MGSDTTLVDSNVLLDIFTEDPQWAQWSSEQLAQAADRGPPAINPIVYAEVSTRFDRLEDLDRLLPESWFRRDPLPYRAGFLAAKALLAYRERGGRRTSPLPDFYIGAHAAVAGHQLLTPGREALSQRLPAPHHYRADPSLTDLHPHDFNQAK